MGVLYVPVSVQALVAGKGGQRVKNMRPSFSVLERMPLGSAAEAAPDDVTILKSGIHLHWTMPDSLLHGVKKGEEVEFPILPDRWVVQRLERREGRIERKVWQIAGSAVHLFDPDEEYGNSSVTVPMYEKTDGGWRPCGPSAPGKKTPKPYGYLGRCELLTSEGTFKEPEVRAPLTAVGWGDPQFAAAYQKCASCFGFWDEVTEERKTQYTYVVCGFYSCHEEDPLREEGKEKELFWSVLDGQGEAAARTVCHGTVCGVMWPGAGEKVKGGVPEGEVEVSLGNNFAEALAALLQGHFCRERGMERLLLYHQQDLWELAASAGADELVAAEEESHRRQFSDIFRGYRYELERADEKEDFDALETKDYVGLEKLNEMQERLDSMRAAQSACAQRLYVFWCRYIYLSDLMGRTNEDCEKELSLCLEEMKDAASQSAHGWDEARAYESEILSFAERLQEQIAGNPPIRNLRIVKKERERGYVPNPPVIAVHGEGVSRSYRQGYQSDEDGWLPCRMHTVTWATAARGGKERCFSLEDARERVTKKPACMPEFCDDVALEAVLLEEYLLDALWEGCLENSWDFGGGFEEGKGTFCGLRPFGLSFAPWSQPWNPLELVWEVTIEPCIRRFDEEDILRNFVLGDIDFWSRESKDSALEKFSISGSTLLTPQGAYVMRDRLGGLTGEDHPLLSSVGAQETLSQQAEGFYEDCAGKKDSFQIPLFWGRWKEKETGISLEALQWGIKGDVFEPVFGRQEYLPVRSGRGKITKLWIVDSFGQIKEVQTWEKQAKVHIAESLRTGEQKEFLLTPRFLCGCALDVRWLCAREGLKGAVTPETTPVCGFVRPDLVNKSILFYDSGGNVLGCLESAGKRCHFTPFSKDIGALEHFPDAVLREFALRLSGDAPALRELLGYLGRHFADCPGEEKSFYQLCFGKVLALAQISVNVSAVGDYDRQMRKEETKEGGCALHYVTNGYEKCRFRIRMGDARKCREGLSGFFLSPAEGELPDFSFMQAANPSAACPGNRFVRAENEWEHSLASLPQTMALLFDPFSEISIRTGLLPARSLKLEEHFFGKAVDKMETVFPVRPFLHPASSVQMPLPQAESERWQWVPADSEEHLEELGISAPGQDLYSGRKKIEEGHVKLPKGEKL